MFQKSEFISSALFLGGNLLCGMSFTGRRNENYYICSLSERIIYHCCEIIMVILLASDSMHSQLIDFKKLNWVPLNALSLWNCSTNRFITLLESPCEKTKTKRSHSHMNAHMCTLLNGLYSVIQIIISVEIFLQPCGHSGSRPI